MYADSSVEFFADPTDGDEMYFNFEANCCGQFKLAWQAIGWRERGIGRTLMHLKTPQILPSRRRFRARWNPRAQTTTAGGPRHGFRSTSSPN